jgi:hypothetical protein
LPSNLPRTRVDMGSISYAPVERRQPSRPMSCTLHVVRPLAHAYVGNVSMLFNEQGVGLTDDHGHWADCCGNRQLSPWPVVRK